ncbi:hypothetical protein, partial [Sphaerospermopsis sp. FACHB-1194]|uniref:hypothetical protein n=1 Tax=Sphaerospermopsis sp. FACHB-1194 TaxID=2692862 RepID=UPI001A7EFE47
VVGFVCLTSFNIADLSGNVNYFFKNFLDFLGNGLKALLEQGFANQINCSLQKWLVSMGLPMFDTLRPKGAQILDSTSPLRLDPLQFLTSEVVLSSSFT